MLRQTFQLMMVAGAPDVSFLLPHQLSVPLDGFLENALTFEPTLWCPILFPKAARSGHKAQRLPIVLLGWNGHQCS